MKHEILAVWFNSNIAINYTWIGTGKMSIPVKLRIQALIYWYNNKIYKMLLKSYFKYLLK